MRCCQTNANSVQFPAITVNLATFSNGNNIVDFLASFPVIHGIKKLFNIGLINAPCVGKLTVDVVTVDELDFILFTGSP